jgi:hypothetical protein
LVYKEIRPGHGSPGHPLFLIYFYSKGLSKTNFQFPAEYFLRGKCLLLFYLRDEMNLRTGDAGLDMRFLGELQRL